MALHLSDYFGCHIREVIDIFKSEQKDCGFSTYIQALKEKKILKVTLPWHSSQYYYLFNAKHRIFKTNIDVLL